jgi:hypothetical protein
MTMSAIPETYNICEGGPAHGHEFQADPPPEYVPTNCTRSMAGEPTKVIWIFEQP